MGTLRVLRNGAWEDLLPSLPGATGATGPSFTGPAGATGAVGATGASAAGGGAPDSFRFTLAPVATTTPALGFMSADVYSAAISMVYISIVDADGRNFGSTFGPLRAGGMITTLTTTNIFRSLRITGDPVNVNNRIAIPVAIYTYNSTAWEAGQILSLSADYNSPPGGTAGQIWTKSSSNDFHGSWVTPSPTPLYASKATSFTISAAASTFTDVPEMSVTVPSAGTYSFDVPVFSMMGSSASMSLRFGYTGSVTSASFNYFLLNNTTIYNHGVNGTSTLMFSTGVQVSGTSSAACSSFLRGSVVFGSGGTFTLQASRTSTSGNPLIYPGTSMLVYKAA